MRRARTSLLRRTIMCAAGVVLVVSVVAWTTTRDRLLLIAPMVLISGLAPVSVIVGRMLWSRTRSGTSATACSGITGPCPECGSQKEREA